MRTRVAISMTLTYLHSCILMRNPVALNGLR